jgi:hypothetical protein
MKFFSKSWTRQFGLILIIVGLLIPSILYPFTSLNPEARLAAGLYASRGVTYERKIDDLQILIKEGKPKLDPKKNRYYFVGEYEDRLVIPYKYLLALGITLFFIGIAVATFSKKRNSTEKFSELNQGAHKDFSNMNSIFQCEHCGQKLRFPIKNELLKITCTSCKNTFHFQKGKRVYL